MKTTTNSGRPDYSLGFLKTILVVGTIAATFLGTRLLGQQAIPDNEPVTVVVPADSPQGEYALPPSYTNPGRTTQIELQPIPQAITPRIAPITRTRSSQ